VTLTLLLAALALTIGALALILWPAMRAARPPARSSFDLAVYRDQLKEVARDQERGLIGAEEARAAKLEIERRMLRAAAPEQTAPATAPGRRWVIAAAACLPIFALLVYLRLGTPWLPDEPIASRATEPRPPDIARMVAGLEARLEQQPNDAEGWLMLGRSRMVLRDPEAAATAYRRALALEPGSAAAVAGLGESLTAAAKGVVTPEAQKLFERLATLAPDEPRAGYYLGLAAAQAGDDNAAVEHWRRLLAQAPSDAPWRPTVAAAIRDSAKRMGVDADAILAGVPGRPPARTATAASPGPDAAAGPGAALPAGSEAAAIAALPPAEQLERIRQMVDGLAARLAADGSDLKGWIRLARAQAVLGDDAAAAAAWAKARALEPDDPEVIKGYASSLLRPPAKGSDLPEIPDEAAELYAKALVLQPSDPEPLWYLGIRALQEGKPAEARQRWQQLLAELDPRHPDYAQISQRLRKLPGS
jgi:cytochrome c-type biogenesis protein CcmH